MSSLMPPSELASLLMEIAKTHALLGRQYDTLARKIDSTVARQADATTVALAELRENIDRAFERLHERSVGQSADE